MRNGKAKIGPIQVTVTSLVDESLWCSLRFPGPADITGKVDDKEIPIIECNDNLDSNFVLYPRIYFYYNI